MLIRMIKRNNNHYILVSVLGIIMCLLFYKTGLVHAEEDEKRVLFISSYSESFITVPDQIRGLQSVFINENIHLDIEYMDTKRITTEENIRNFYNNLKYKLESLPSYDAIIVGDDAALQFALDYQEELFSKIPIIFFGINDKERAKIATANPYIAGSIEETSLVENIEIALLFNNKADKVVAIVDDTLTGQGDQKQFETASAFFDNLDFEVLNASNYSFDEFGEILLNISDNTIMLFLSMNQDITGEYLDLEKQFLFIKEHCNFPVYRASVGGVGDGLIGGKMISYEAMGKNAADLVVEIFGGTQIESVVLIEQTPYHYLFDYELIKKYKIDKALIPEDAVLINKEINPLEKYRKYILATGIIFLFLSALAVVLTIDNIKRRRMQKELRESHEELSATYEELTASEEELKMQYEVIQEHANEVNTLYEKLNIAIQGTNSAVWEWDSDTEEIEVSENFAKIVNRSIWSPIKTRIFVDTYIHPEYREDVINEFERCSKGEKEEVNIQVLTNGGKECERWILIRGKAISDSKDEIIKISGIFLDITVIKEKEAYIEYLANHDYLTHLPNRMNFMDKLSFELKRGASGAVFLLDVDNFKSINDTLGHVYGDQLLILIADRFKQICDNHMLIARLGGDEFLVLLTNVTEHEKIEQCVQRIIAAFDEAFILDNHENYINFSMGITCYPADSNNINQLIMNADTAMYKVKHDGKNSYIYYHEDMKIEVESKIEMEVILRRAVKEDGFYLLYQPQVETITGNIIGFEALLRLKDRSISPGVFIPIAEETGHIIQIGRWVAKEAISQIAAWREKGYQEKVIAINYSSKQLRDKGYINYLKEVLDYYGVRPESIEIEITESILLENNVQTLEFLHELKKIGFQIALDDFGTGYSSLNYLTFIPVDKIKLDKSINDKFLEHENTLLMDNLISLVHSLNLKITAEGIEDEDKFIKLKKGGCDYIQGYLFSRPLCLEDVERIYDTNLIERLRISK